MKIKAILQKLGLSETEARVYTAILKLGSGTVSTISKMAGSHRPTIYKSLSLLIEKNLVSRSRLGKRTVYVAEKPTVLSSLFEVFQDDFKQALPDLLKLYSRAKHRPIIRYFEGKEGVRHIYIDLLETVKRGGIIYRYESPKDYKKNKKLYPRLYLERAGDHSEIEKFVITNKKTHEQRRPQLERYSKYVPPSEDPFEYNITQIIYGDKVAFIDYDAETACIIESAKFAQFQQRIFRLLFSSLR